MRPWEDMFLSWFAGQGIAMSERSLQLGGFRYHHFSTLFEAPDKRACTCHGRSQDRKIAAVKCAAETIERKFMARFFNDSTATLRAPKVQYEDAKLIRLETDEERPLPPPGLRTSNGWAIHQTREQSEQGAFREALERHLLLKSYLKYGWNGFQQIELMKTDDMALHFLVSRFSSNGLVAGLVVAKSPLYTGVSFGYCLGQMDEARSTLFWESAIFEAIDKILTLGGRKVNISFDPDSWIYREIQHYLESPFDEALLSGTDKPHEPEEPRNFYLHSFDLGSTFGLNFPLFASYAWGENLIPLFHKSKATGAARQYLEDALTMNGLSLEIPERHPVL